MTTGTNDTTSAGTPAGTTSAGTPADTNPGTGGTAAATPTGAPAGNPAAAPEAYQPFQLPDGVKFDDAYLQKKTEAFKAAGLTQEAAQQIINVEAENVRAGEAALQAQWQRQVTAWETELASDKDFGGNNLDKTRQTANIAITKFGGQGLQTVLQKTGLGKHPDVIRAFARIGGLLREDSPGGGNLPSGQSLSKEQEYVNTLYPTATQ